MVEDPRGSGGGCLPQSLEIKLNSGGGGFASGARVSPSARVLLWNRWPDGSTVHLPCGTIAQQLTIKSYVK
jgi:uncharacterized spore protein YtfJ